MSDRDECPIGLGQIDATPAWAQRGAESNLPSHIHHRSCEGPECSAPWCRVARIGHQSDDATRREEKPYAALDPHADECTKSHLASVDGGCDVAEGRKRAPTRSRVAQPDNGLKAILRR